MELRSSALEAGESIPVRYTCDGEGISPPLEWRYVPQEAKSLGLICDDPDASRGPWSHWVVYNIPVDVSGLPEGIEPGGRLPWGGAQGRNESGRVQYGAPCPPRGSTHHYHFRLYALDEDLDLPPGATRQQLLQRIEGHVLDETELVVPYRRR